MGGLSRERIRQIEARAIAKLRRLAERDRRVHEVLDAVLSQSEPVNLWEEMRTRK